MLLIPGRGFPVSRSKHNGHLDIHADWVEASALFSADTVSQTHVVDALIENHTYQDQDFANEWVSNVFRELRRRFDLLGDAGILVNEGDRIRRPRVWGDRPAYSFCVALAVLPHYRRHVEAKCGRSYEEQGRLFEQLCTESLKALQWDIEAIGWSKAAATSITAKVAALASAVGEPANPGAITRWTRKHTKDAGLDLIAWAGFPDEWGGRPICLIQCASGEDWRDKLHYPNIATWEKLIDFSTKPRRGLVMPFAPESEEFRLRSNTDMLMLLMDRHRLLSPGREDSGEFPSRRLAKCLLKWTEKRVSAFPKESP